MKRCLIVFAKEPTKGRVKTRLTPYLSESQCVKLYKAFLKDTINLANSIQCAQRIMAYDCDTANPAYLKKIARGFLFYEQKGKNLGEKMHNAFQFAHEHNASKMVLMGSDFPTLPARFIEEAFRRLDTNDIVLGPSFDGGFYLIGLKRPHSALFNGIKWSTEGVLSHTVKNARILKQEVVKLDEWYDIDDISSLRRLQRDLRKVKNKATAKWTSKFLKSSIPTGVSPAKNTEDEPDSLTPA